MRKFLISFTSTGAKLLLTFNENNLVAFQLDGELDEQRYVAMTKIFPWQLQFLDTKWKGKKNIRVSEVERDLSFKHLWEVYSYKVGNKKRAEKLWEKLSETNKASAIDYISTYDNHLALNRGLSKLYPETYINQERWNN